MSKEIAKEKATTLARRLGKAAVHAIAPDDFEYYACSFELVDSGFNVKEIFHFPVMPSGIQIGRQSLVSIKKTGSSYLSQFNDSFVGRTFNINGTFGRKFKVILVKNDLKFKTGYGALKMLEKIIEESFVVSGSNPKVLIFNNLSFNQSYVVEVLNFQVSQSMENNMMWNYTLEIKAIANVDNIKMAGHPAKRLVKLLGVDVAQKTANDLFEEIPDDNEFVSIPKSLMR